MDRRATFLNFTLRTVGGAVILSLATARAQNPSPAVRQMTIMISGEERGAGFIIGDDKSSIDIITAAHVINPRALPRAAGLPVQLRFHGDQDAHPDCSVLASAKEAAKNSEQVDAALVRCTKQPGKTYALSYDIGGDITELKSSAPLMLIANLPVDDKTTPSTTNTSSAQSVTPDKNKPTLNYQLWTVPQGYFLFDRFYPSNKDPQVIEFLNLRQYRLQGASGGPLITDRSEFIGIVYEQYNPGDVLVKALTWSSIAGSEWIKKAGAHVKISRQARSAAALRRNNVEFTVGAASMYVPNFGLLGIAPKFRISSALPNAPSVVLGFDFTYAKATKLNGSTETVSLTVPSVTAEWQLGGVLGPLRRRQLLGGVYLGAGIAPASLDRSLTGGVGRLNVRSWTGVFDAGWRYRFPGRSWGITASFREGVLFDSSIQQLYPRFREISYGMFVILK